MLLRCNLANVDSCRVLRVGISVAVQWLRLHALNVGGMDSTPGPGTKFLHATGHGQKNKCLGLSS